MERWRGGEVESLIVEQWLMDHCVPDEVLITTVVELDAHWTKQAAR